jgi:FkbM family methyltransferase
LAGIGKMKSGARVVVGIVFGIIVGAFFRTAGISRDDDVLETRSATSVHVKEIGTGKIHHPLAMDKDVLVVTNGTTTTPIWPTVQKGDIRTFRIPDGITSILVEVGSNNQPELTQLLKDDPHAFLIAFEPQPLVFAELSANVGQLKTNRVMIIPAAIAPEHTFLTMYVSKIPGCSSLRAMNEAASRFANKNIKVAPKKSLKTKLRTVAFCASADSQIKVPTFPLSSILSLIPPNLPIGFMMVDAQGFDLSVVSTIGVRRASSIHQLVVECQDLRGDKGDSVLFLVQGAPTCAEVRDCIERHFPHRLSHCYINAEKVRELNCVFMHPDVPARERKPIPQMMVAGGSMNVTYTARLSARCPNFLP